MVYDIIIAGAVGGLVKALHEGKNKIAYPQFEENYFYLGFLGHIVIGAAVAYFLVNNDPASAFTAGVTSNFIIEALVERTKKK